MYIHACRPEDEVQYPALSGSTLFPPDGLSMNLGLVVLATLAGEQVLGIFRTLSYIKMW